MAVQTFSNENTLHINKWLELKELTLQISLFETINILKVHNYSKFLMLKDYLIENYNSERPFYWLNGTIHLLCWS